MEIFKIIKSPLAQKTLTYFFTNPEKSHYLRELAAILGEDAGNLSRMLRKFEAEEILLVSFSGNQKFFSLNREYSLFTELAGLIEKTVGIEGAFRETLAKIKGISLAFIYGSSAKKKTDYTSDIDLFLVGKFNEDKLLKAVDNLEKRLGKEINYVFYSEEEFEQAKKTNSFVKGVIKEPKIMVKGRENEL